MNAALLRHTVAANAVRVFFICAGLVLMGVIMPVMYASFGQEMSTFIESVPFFAQLASSFGGGNVLTLDGSLALAFNHPFTLLLVGILAIAFPALAIAGERERGTLEVTLARPVSRRGLLATLYLAGIVFITVAVTVLVTTTAIAGVAVGFGAQMDFGHLAQLWLADVLLFTMFLSLGFLVSTGADRAAPAIGIPAAVVLLGYLAWAIGAIWPDVHVLADWSPFQLLKAQRTLADGVAVGDLVVMVGVSVLLMVVAFYRFPRRDLPAPS